MLRHGRSYILCEYYTLCILSFDKWFDTWIEKSITYRPLSLLRKANITSGIGLVASMSASAPAHTADSRRRLRITRRQHVRQRCDHYRHCRAWRGKRGCRHWSRPIGATLWFKGSINSPSYFHISTFTTYIVQSASIARSELSKKKFLAKLATNQAIDAPCSF